MSEPAYFFSHETGRGAAFVSYVLYLVSIPSAGILALVGVILAYAARDGAQGVARVHIERQIAVWWIAFWWAVAIWVATGIGIVLSVVLIGIPILILAGLASLVIMIWFTIVSALGLIALLDGRPG